MSVGGGDGLVAFESSCRHLRVLRWSVVASLVLAVPVSVGAILLGYRVIGTGELGFVTGGFFIGSYVTSAVLLALLRCPRCGGRFTRFTVLWPRKCARCGFEC